MRLANPTNRALDYDNSSLVLTSLSSSETGIALNFILDCSGESLGKVDLVADDLFEMDACDPCILEKDNERRLVLV